MKLKLNYEFIYCKGSIIFCNKIILFLIFFVIKFNSAKRFLL